MALLLALPYFSRYGPLFMYTFLRLFAYALLILYSLFIPRILYGQSVDTVEQIEPIDGNDAGIRLTVAGRVGVKPIPVENLHRFMMEMERGFLTDGLLDDDLFNGQVGVAYGMKVEFDRWGLGLEGDVFKERGVREANDVQVLDVSVLSLGSTVNGTYRLISTPHFEVSPSLGLGFLSTSFDITAGNPESFTDAFTSEARSWSFDNIQIQTTLGLEFLYGIRMNEDETGQSDLVFGLKGEYSYGFADQWSTNGNTIVLDNGPDLKLNGFGLWLSVGWRLQTKTRNGSKDVSLPETE